MKLITATTIKDNVTAMAAVPSCFLALLKNVLQHTGKQNLLEVSPNLELFIHGRVSFTPYHEQYRELVPSDQMAYLETYNASEGFFAVQDDLKDPGMLLMLDYGVFFEFMPLSELGETHPHTLQLNRSEEHTSELQSRPH